MTILCIGGGSIGHTAPCVAVARALRSLDPGITVHIACADREEEALFLTTEGFPHTTLPLPRRGFFFPLSLLRSLRQSKKLLRSLRPDVVFCKGGVLSIAPAWHAHRLGIPVILHESDATMGRANRLIARWAATVCLGMDNPRSESRIPNPVVTGNPVRPEIMSGEKEEGLRLTGFSGSRPVLLILGGSQGSEALNAFIRDHLKELLNVCDVAHITGQGKTPAPAHTGYWTLPFAQGQLPHLYAIASIALSRSGAGAISELAVNGIPSVFIPLEGLAQDHQLRNAEAATESGGCILLRQETMGRALLPLIRRLLSDEGTRKKMSESIRKLYRENAARSIANAILDLAGKSQDLRETRKE